MTPLDPPVNAPFPDDNSDLPLHPSTVSAADQRAFTLATLRLREALRCAAAGDVAIDVAAARLELRAVAVKLRDGGFWRTDKQGLRATVSLLWEADRFVNDQALLMPRGTVPL